MQPRFNYNQDLIYHTKCPEPTCTDNYNGESAGRIIERIKDHNGREHTSNVFKHSIEKSHKNVNTIDFKIIDKNFHNKWKNKIAEVLCIKDLRLTLKVQEKSIELNPLKWLWQ